MFCFGGIGGLFRGGGGSSSRDDSLGDSYTARYMCEEFVKDRLKSPGSADFSGQRESNTGTAWTSSGAVDSENSFGATMRNTYTCTVRFAGGDKWTLVSLQGLTN